jgi:hypothetical protein
MSTPIDGWHSRTVKPSEFILIRGGSGSDNFMMNISDSQRVNKNQANFAFLFGERSEIRPGASGSGAFGGKIYIGDGILRYKNDSGEPEDAYYGGENSYGFGYKVWVYGKQLFAGGYNITAYARESIVWGDNITINCDPSKVNSGDNNSTNNVGVAVLGRGITIGYHGDAFMVTGKQHSIGTGLFCSNISGEHMIIGNNCKWINIAGGGNSSDGWQTVGDNCEDLTIFGYSNVAEKYTTDSFVSGYKNVIHNYSDSYQTGKQQYIYILGHENEIANNSSNYRNKNIYIFGNNCLLTHGHSDGVYIFGHHLFAVNSEASEVIKFGCYNLDWGRSDSTPSQRALIEVGCGTSQTRATDFVLTKTHSLFVGYMTGGDGHKIDSGHNFEDGIITGYKNKVGKINAYGCSMFGSYNTMYSGSTDRDTSYEYCGIIGAHNEIQLSSGVGIMLFGYYLRATDTKQTIVGRYNDYSSAAYTNAIFAVGTGSANNSRATMFSVFDDGIKIGTNKITPSDASHVPEIPNKLDKTTTGSKKQVYGVNASNQQTMYEVSDGTGGHAGKEGKIYEMPTGGIPANDLGFSIPGTTLYRHTINFRMHDQYWEYRLEESNVYAYVTLVIINSSNTSYTLNDIRNDIIVTGMYNEIVECFAQIYRYDDSYYCNARFILGEHDNLHSRVHNYGILLEHYDVDVPGVVTGVDWLAPASQLVTNHGAIEFHDLTSCDVENFTDTVTSL